MPQRLKQEMPPLAIYKSIKDYKPEYGDFIVWTGWLTTWHGVVTNYFAEEGQLNVIFSTLPFLLFTMDDAEQEKETRILNLSKVRNSANGVFSVCQFDRANNTPIWYI